MQQFKPAMNRRSFSRITLTTAPFNRPCGLEFPFGWLGPCFCVRGGHGPIGEKWRWCQYSLVLLLKTLWVIWKFFEYYWCLDVLLLLKRTSHPKAIQQIIKIRYTVETCIIVRRINGTVDFDDVDGL